MPRILYTCAYDGAPWRGWQSQAGGGTVQDCVESAFAAILKEPLRISAAGRTDAGVHALGQRFHADVPASCRMSPQAWVAALNAHLPASVRVLSAEPVEDSFHARFSAVGKVYEYRLYRAPVLLPHLVGRVWHHPHPLDVELLRQALLAYCGEHDFRRFAARRGNEPDPPPADYYLRTIYDASLHEESADMLCLRFHGSGFMYRMVRMLVGAACRVAAGRMPLQELCRALAEPLGEHSRHCAPAAGLYLLRVCYNAAE